MSPCANAAYGVNLLLDSLLTAVLLPNASPNKIWPSPCPAALSFLSFCESSNGTPHVYKTGSDLEYTAQLAPLEPWPPPVVVPGHKSKGLAVPKAP